MKIETSQTRAGERQDETALALTHETGWSSYRPSNECYLHDPLGVHGLGHAGRVLVWSNLIGQWMRERGATVDLEVVRWAATLHDVRRVDDGKDPLHGVRCGGWIGEGLNRVLAAAGDEQIQRIAYCCVWHVPPDSHAPVMTPELICLKDADALDRVRLGALDIRFLRTAFARTLVHQAQFLCDTSETQADFRNAPWNAVRQAALRMGVWSPPHATDYTALRKRLHFFVC